MERESGQRDAGEHARNDGHAVAASGRSSHARRARTQARQGEADAEHDPADELRREECLGNVQRAEIEKAQA